MHDATEIWLYGLPDGIRHSLLVDAIRYGIELVSILYTTGSVYGRTLKEVKDTLFWRTRMKRV
ncbi:MAG: hypothetical protein DRH04_10625 [Deltaproteobacteria bacterium]|nr:MAG: hypothetical protein DRH04_10625 [Deltaproteobacteria bacterium]